NLYWSTGRQTDTERVLHEALGSDPKDLQANRAFAMFLIASNRPTEAEPYLKTIVDVSKESGSRLLLANYYIAFGRKQDAKALLDDLIKNDPQSFSVAKLRLATLAVADGDRAAGYALVDDVLKKNPRDVAALVVRSDIQLRDKKIDDGLASAEAAAKIDP